MWKVSLLRKLLFNCKFSRQQLYNTSSKAANFAIDVAQLRRVEKSLARAEGDEKKTSEAPADSTNYMMLISAVVNNRLTSDINLSFKLADTEEARDRSANASRYTPQLQQQPDKGSTEEEGGDDSGGGGGESEKETKRTNAASFQTDTISRLPLIWHTFMAVVSLLILLILIVLVKVYIRRHRQLDKNAKPRVRFNIQHDDSTTAQDDSQFLR